MADEKGIDRQPFKVQENNRIVKKDVENYTPSAAPAKSGATTSYPAATGVESYTEVPNPQMRKAIARTLSASKFSAPHFYLKMEVDMEMPWQPARPLMLTGKRKSPSMIWW